MEDNNVTLKTAGELGLLPEEFDRIVKLLGRMPNNTELSVFSVMWSEHCSYKNSIAWLRKLPFKGLQMLAEPGEENAGLIDIGDGFACCFKIESRNHPTAAEPYQGAATAVGGINRDVFTMGARPIAQLNSLRLGSLDNDRTQWLLREIAKGIGDYSNAFGVPMVGGEIYFEECYQSNPLINVMSVGVVKKEDLVSSKATGVGNQVYLIGAATGRDGILGATLDSTDFTNYPHEKLPDVQSGDPFLEKLLLETTLELIKTGAIVGMQDLGAGGISCATAEMSASGKSGMNIYLDKVNIRQKSMKPWEILLSETQERMLIVVKKGSEKDVEAIFDKWDVKHSIIGEVIEADQLNYFWNEEIVAQIPASSLVVGGGAPVYERSYKEPAYYKESKRFDIKKINVPADMRAVAKLIVSHPNIASKKWVYQQYDSMVQTRNLTANQPSDAAIVNIKSSDVALALTVDCNARYVYADPEIGTQIAVAEAARNIVCAGAIPCAITNCLNFGNPYNPEDYWQFVGAIQGMSKACEKFNTPVSGGNVSFYNQSSFDGSNPPAYPSPIIGMVGLLEDKAYQMTMDFKKKGDVIFLLGKNAEDLSSSQYLTLVHDVKLSPPPYFNPDEELQLHNCIRDLIREGYISSAHDISDGGLFVSLMESAMVRDLGFAIETDEDMRLDAFLFGEAQGRAIVSVDSDREEAFVKFVNEQGIPILQLGHVTKGEFRIDGDSYGFVSEYKDLYHNTIGGMMKGSMDPDIE